MSRTLSHVDARGRVKMVDVGGKPVTDRDTIMISPNAGPSSFAGKECSPNLFVTSYQNDQVHAVLGKHAQDSGMKRLFLIAPNYQAGKDAMVGFMRYFKGEVADEVYVPLGQLDKRLEGVVAVAPQPVLVGAVDKSRAGAILGGVPEPIASEDEVKAFVTTLLETDRIAPEAVGRQQRRRPTGERVQNPLACDRADFDELGRQLLCHGRG